MPCAIFSRSAPHDIARRVAVVMPYHALGPSIVPGTELILTVPARLVAQFADSSPARVPDAPHELGEVQFRAVGHPRIDDNPAHSWFARWCPPWRHPAKHRPGGPEIVVS